MVHVWVGVPLSLYSLRQACGVSPEPARPAAVTGRPTTEPVA
ncbi:hypothetical protein [Sphaerimonospora mesophila]